MGVPDYMLSCFPTIFCSAFLWCSEGALLVHLLKAPVVFSNFSQGCKTLFLKFSCGVAWLQIVFITCALLPPFAFHCFSWFPKVLFFPEDFHMVSMWRFHRSQSVLRPLSECVRIAPEIYSLRFPCNVCCTFVTVARWFSPRCLLVSCWFPHATLVNYLSLFADFLKCSYAFPLACL